MPQLGLKFTYNGRQVTRNDVMCLTLATVPYTVRDTNLLMSMYTIDSSCTLAMAAENSCHAHSVGAFSSSSFHYGNWRESNAYVCGIITLYIYFVCALYT